jgi:hypothetical protein
MRPTVSAKASRRRESNRRPWSSRLSRPSSAARCAAHLLHAAAARQDRARHQAPRRLVHAASTPTTTSPSRPTATRWPRTWAPTPAPSCDAAVQAGVPDLQAAPGRHRQGQHPDRRRAGAPSSSAAAARSRAAARTSADRRPLKDHEEARSQAVRDQAWNWFTKVAMTRRMGKKLVIITMTRWHSDDIIGRLTDPENPHYNAIEAKRSGRSSGCRRSPKTTTRSAASRARRFGRSATTSTSWRASSGSTRSASRALPAAADVADGVLFRRENIQRYHPTSCPRTCAIYCAERSRGRHQAAQRPVLLLLKVGVDAADNIYSSTATGGDADGRRRRGHAGDGLGGTKRPLLWWAERGHISQVDRPVPAQADARDRHLHQHPRSDAGRRQGDSARSRSRPRRDGQGLFPIGPMWAEKAHRRDAGVSRTERTTTSSMRSPISASACKASSARAPW